MEINNNYTGIYVSQVNYKTNSISSPELSKSYLAEMDKVEISSQSVTSSSEVNTSDYSDEEIAEFLKDKPYTAFMYEYHQKYTPDKEGKGYITDVMDRYYNKKIQDSGYLLHMQVNSEALEKGLDTLDKFKEQIAKEAKAKQAFYISTGLSWLPEVQEYEADYGVSVSNFRNNWNLLNIGLKLDTSFMYQDMKVDENGQVMILLKESEEWVTREEFIEMYPDYELYESLDIDAYKKIKSELSQTEGGIKQYTEEFISGLSEEEIQMIKDNNFFSSPALQVTGIKGIEQFAKDIDDIDTAEVRQWSGLNDRREELIELAEEAKLRFAQKMSRSELKEGEIPSYENLYIILPYYSSVSERDAKLIKELGLSDYIKIDTRQIDLEKGTIAGYRLDMDFINEYSECFYNPEKDPVKMQSLFYTNEEYDKMLSMYGSAKNIEKAYLYALDNNLSLDILTNDYTSAIGADISEHKELHSNLNGRDDFLESIFSKENNNTANQETNITINIELDLKSKYLSSLTKNNNIDTLLDII